MAFCNDREDIYSMSLTGNVCFALTIEAVKSLVEKYNIPWKDIGRLEVGTETM